MASSCSALATDKTAGNKKTSEIHTISIAENSANDFYNEDLAALTTLGFIHSNTATLHLRKCIHVTDLTPIYSCEKLTSLSLWGCVKISDQILKNFSALCSLKHLDLSCCIGMNNLMPLQGCKNLNHLNLYYCNQISSIEVLQNCIALSSFPENISTFASPINGCK